ncbi:hypothetical protein HY449_01205 [Candidatus Pacearchaeota archaeon]|nr:hypothetical protein [Candidatus Pacearchaeota archaeon]
MKKQKSCPSSPIEIPQLRKIIFTDKKKFPWRKNRNGYFLIKIQEKKIHCGFVNWKNKMIFEFVGKNPDKMIKEIAKRKLCDLEHMGYIASELTVAENFLKGDKKYIQR